MVTPSLSPAMAIVAVRQRATAWLRLCHCCRACGPLVKASANVGIEVPSTKAVVACVSPVRLAGTLDRHGEVPVTFGFTGTADHPAGRSATDRRRPWSGV